MSSVDVSVLVEMVEGWRRSAGEMNETDDAVDAMDGCADELADAIAEGTEGAAPPTKPLPLAGVVVGPWHVDRGAHRARYFAAAAHHPDAAATMDFDEERWCWTVWHQRDCVKHGAGTAPTQALAEAAADAHLRELGATLEGGEPEADGDGVWCYLNDLPKWLMANGSCVAFVKQGGGPPSAGARLHCRCSTEAAQPIQPLAGDSLTLTAPDTGPDHRVIRRNGVPIGVIDVTQVDALQPDALNGQPVTMVVLSSGRRVPYAMGVVDLAWQLGISEVAQ